MSKSNTFENGLLQLIFNNADIANIGDAAGIQGAAAAGNLYISLHTADPGEAGDQTTNEAAYTGYLRKAVARSGAGFTVSGGQVQNAAIIAFDECTAGTATISHFGVGTDLSGVGTLLYSGTLNQSLSVSAGVSPEIAINGITITED